MKTGEIPHIAKVHGLYVHQYTSFPFHYLLELITLIVTNNVYRLVNIAKKLRKQFPGSERASVPHHSHTLNDRLGITNCILVCYGTLQEGRRLQISGICTHGTGRWVVINTLGE